MSDEQDKRRRYGLGGVFQRGRVWWVRWSCGGTEYRQSSESEKEADAVRLLKKKLGEVGRGRVVAPSEARVTVEELADELILALKTRGAKAVPSFKSHLKPVRAALGHVRALNLTTARLREYITQRQADGMADATINRETGALRQAFRVAFKGEKVSRVPYFPMLRENNVRRGFFERADFEAVAAKLPDPIDVVARFAYLSGWRKGEILPLPWSAVDRSAREIRLATSKNGDGRVLPYTEGSALDRLVEARWKAREYETPEKQTGISAYLFHRQGRPLADIRKAWAKACREARVVKPCDSCDGVPAPEDAVETCRRCEGHGTLPGRLLHDLRRTGVRDMTRAGVPQSVAMAISGHKTISVFLRYNITDEKDKREALTRTEAHRATQSAIRNVEGIG